MFHCFWPPYREGELLPTLVVISEAVVTIQIGTNSLTGQSTSADIFISISDVYTALFILDPSKAKD